MYIWVIRRNNAKENHRQQYADLMAMSFTEGVISEIA